MAAESSTFEVFFKTRADLAAAQATETAIKGVASEAQKAASAGGGGGLEKAGTGIESLIGKYVGVAAIAATVTGLVRDSIAAFSESEEASLKLANALEQTGQASAGMQEKIEALSSAQQLFTNISDETWNEAAARLIQFGVAADEIEGAFPIIEGLAGLMGGNVPAAAELFARAMAGNTRGLAQLGIKIEEGATKLEIHAAMANRAAAAAGLLEKQTKTMAGSYEGLKLAGGDLIESTGTMINKGGLLTDTLRNMALAMRTIRDGSGNIYEQMTKEAVLAFAKSEKLRLSQEGIAAALVREEEAGKRTAAVLSSIADQYDRIAKSAAKAREEMSEDDAHVEKVAEAKKALDLAKIESAEKAGKITPTVAAVARENVEARFSGDKAQRDTNRRSRDGAADGALQKEASDAYDAARRNFMKKQDEGTVTADDSKIMKAAYRAKEKIEEEAAERSAKRKRNQERADELIPLEDRVRRQKASTEIRNQRAEETKVRKEKTERPEKADTRGAENLAGARDIARDAGKLKGRSDESTDRLQKAASALNDGATGGELDALNAVLEKLATGLEKRGKDAAQLRTLQGNVKKLEASLTQLQNDQNGSKN